MTSLVEVESGVNLAVECVVNLRKTSKYSVRCINGSLYCTVLNHLA